MCSIYFRVTQIVFYMLYAYINYTSYIKSSLLRTEYKYITHKKRTIEIYPQSQYQPFAFMSSFYYLWTRKQFYEFLVLNFLRLLYMTSFIVNWIFTHVLKLVVYKYSMLALF